jgi:para-aminobenzoate synthetase/4-amino-4-deoxychorismate lyase
MVGFVAYDAAPALEAKFEIRQGFSGPLVFFLACRPEPGATTVPSDRLSVTREDWHPDFDEHDYTEKVREIINGIGRGDYYQVNLTERFSSRIDDPFGVYERLRDAQSAPYSAYIDTADLAVMSVSPELFLRRTGGLIECRPMKGTSRRGRWIEEDDAFARQLSMSEKERAENVMIVDLIRNDMGRIAVAGSVEVESMFSLERYPTVLQMTSHVKSQLKPETSFADIFAALFPCGSITGAPKIAASKSIRKLEGNYRGIYCGAIGVVRPGAIEFVFNVAIRTVVIDRATGTATYGAGGGITADSEPDRELAELQAKAAVLTSIPRPIELLETLRLDHGVVSRVDRHLRRLVRSAQYFGFAEVDRLAAEVRSAITTEASKNPTGLHRMRVVVHPDGRHVITVHPHTLDAEPRRLAVSNQPVDSSDRFLYHKLADRRPYSERIAGLEGADDVILVNERGELTETTIGNIVLEIDGVLVTPALACGLLPGIFREVMLESGQITEAVLGHLDLIRATKIWMINSLREWVPCVLRSAS